MITLFLVTLNGATNYFQNVANAQSFAFANSVDFAEKSFKNNHYQNLLSKNLILDLKPDFNPENIEVTAPESIAENTIETVESFEVIEGIENVETVEVIEEIQEAQVIETKEPEAETPANKINLLENQFAELLQVVNELKQENQSLKKVRRFSSSFEMHKFLKDKEAIEKRLNLYVNKLNELNGLNFSDFPVNENEEITSISVNLTIQKGHDLIKVQTSNAHIVKNQLQNWKEVLTCQIEKTQNELKNFEL
jgi:hypothetical protein